MDIQTVTTTLFDVVTSAEEQYQRSPGEEPNQGVAKVIFEPVETSNDVPNAFVVEAFPTTGPGSIGDGQKAFGRYLVTIVEVVE